MDHAAFSELMAGRALGDLDGAEQRPVESHLRSCSGCRSLTRDLDGVLTEMAYAAFPRVAPEALGPSVMSAIQSEAAMPVRSVQATRSVPELGAIRQARFGGLGRGLGVGLAAAAVLAIVVLGAQVVDLRDRLDRAQLVARDAAADLAARNTAMQVVADPSHASAWLAPSTTDVATGALMVYVPGSTDAFLVADGLPATPDGRVYQFWHADAAGLHAGVTFRYDGEGVLVIPVKVDLGGAQAAMLTIEADGGAAAPSQDVVFGELPSS